VNLQGKTSLAESAGWVRQARLVVGNDSGMNHLAETNEVPVVTLFGPTHEAFGFVPHLPRSRTLSVELWCRPCSPTGKRPCFRSEQFCFTAITPAHVLQAMGEAW
jgi:ADP-heptose:LPS heptosyltransferase